MNYGRKSVFWSRVQGQKVTVSMLFDMLFKSK